MSRPGVSVVMPFAGTRAEAASALEALRGLEVAGGDELILVDNSGTAPARGDGVAVIRAAGEQSPSHARNAGAEQARGDWILFLDADCTAPADLLDRFFADPIADDVGAVAGAVVPIDPAPPGAGTTGLAGRYAQAKSFLDQDAHLSHSYMPRAVAANLLVRREAFEAVGGFYEGVRAAEDTDFSWRIQRAGWRLVGRPSASVEHRYRTSLRALRRQWRGYAAGRAWLGRRYDGFAPESAFKRAAGRVVRRSRRARAGEPAFRAGRSSAPPASRLQRGQFLALDAVLGVEELAGFTLSNRPRRAGPAPGAEVRVVLVADRFPARDDPLTDFALSLAGGRVEAGVRPEALAWQVARGLSIDYREDDGAADRVLALTRLLLRHPLRCAGDFAGRRAGGVGGPGLAAIAPAVIRLLREPDARVHPLGGTEPRAVAVRLARLAGRRLQP